MNHARQVFQTFRDIADLGQSLWRSEFLERRNGSLVMIYVRREDYEQNIFGIETQVDVGEEEEAAHHQPCADQEDNGESYLGDDQRRAKLSVARTAVYAFARARQLRLYVRARYTKSRRQTADQRCEDSEG